ncbi:MAG: hypothetical protein ABI221_01530 [Candidatus Saccharimonadales bacterium]
MKNRAKTISLYMVCLIFGLTFIFLINVFPVTNKVPGIHLPFGWQGPSYQVFACEPDCRRSELLFTISQEDLNDGGWYTNNAAGWLDVTTGVALGLGSAVAIDRKLK